MAECVFARRLAAALLAILAVAAPARANDSTAEIGAGGLVLARSENISMDSETLFISMDRVRVDYVFTNRSDKDVNTVVAFPMPDLAMSPYWEVAIPRNEDNFLGFTVTVDGRSITPQLQQRAFVAGVDVTDRIVAAGLPLAPIGDYDGLDVAHLSDAEIDKLEAWGIVVPDGMPEDGARERVSANWTLKSAYWWESVFPAGASVTVEHSYTPATGGAAGVFVLGDGSLSEPTEYYADKYCVDAGFLSAVKKRVGANDVGGPRYFEQWLSYVLSSGANWYGPIGTFRLIVDKGSTDNLVSFCGEGVKKTGPTTFEMSMDGFVPDRDLDFLFIVKSDR